jgi:GT2 family glycosyltransferase
MDKKTIDTTGLFLGKSRKPIERGFNQRDNNQFNKAGYIFGIGQIAGLFRRSALEDVKLGKEYFDENYNIFYEDLDLAWRINLRGWKAYYNPCAVAYHVRGETAKTQNAPLAFFKKYYFSHLSADLQFHLIKNRYMTVIKNDLPKNFILNLPHIFLYDLKLWTYILLLRPMLILRIPKILGYFKVALRKRKILKKRPIEQNTP